MKFYIIIVNGMQLIGMSCGISLHVISNLHKSFLDTIELAFPVYSYP
jgi:hypothetical protein